MRFHLQLPYKEAKKVFKVDKSFKTKSDATQRVIEVSEAFGIGVDEEKVFDIYKGFTIDVKPSDVVYIIGDSGGGKSILLRELAEQMNTCEEFKKVLTDRFAEPFILNNLAEKPLIECVGRDTSEAINLLSMAGLNEAFLFLRKYSELSDGQKYRFRVAWMMNQHDIRTWVFDEFCATLDRICAKVVAFCIQKTARRLGKTLLAATTHRDLLEDLNPNLHVDKRFGSEVHVSRLQPQLKDCSILREVHIAEGSRADYEALEQFHYRSLSPLPRFVNRFYTAKIEDEAVGVIVYGPPYWSVKARNLILPQYKVKPLSIQLKLVNRDFIRIWRVIVAPKYRSIGLGVKLVRETLPLTEKPYVEVYAVMAKYNPFFEKAGMTRVEVPAELRDRGYEKTLSTLEGLGFNLQLLSSKAYSINVLNRLGRGQLDQAKTIIIRNFFARGFRADKELQRRVESLDIEAMAEALKRHRLNPTYLIWRNPNSPL